MSLVEVLTPKDTEEIRPGLFIQKKHGKYRQLHPAAWDGKVNWKNFLLGGSPIKSTLWFAVLIFLVWSYNSDVGAYRDFYETVQGDPQLYCQNVQQAMLTANCSDEFEQLGLCTKLSDDLQGLDVNG